MVASTAVLEQSPADVVREMSEFMEAMATEGEWDRVEELAVKLRSAVVQVPENERRALLFALQHSMEKVHAAAEKARDGVTGKLSSLRRGRDAAKAYGTAY